MSLKISLLLSGNRKMFYLFLTIYTCSFQLSLKLRTLHQKRLIGGFKFFFIIVYLYGCIEEEITEETTSKLGSVFIPTSSNAGLLYVMMS